MSNREGPASKSTKIKVALVIPSLKSAFRYWEPIVRALQSEGVDVLVATATRLDETTSIRLETVPSFMLLRRETTGYARSVRFTSPSLIWKLTKYDPDMIIAVEYGLASLWAVIAGKVSRSRILLLQEHRTPTGSWLTFPRRLLRRALVGLSDGLIANTKAARNEMMNVLGVAEHRVHEIPLVIPPARTDLLREPVTVPQSAVRPIFLFAGRLVLQKNVQSILKAAHLLAAEKRQFHVWIVGDGPLRHDLERMSESLGISDRVSFVGPIPHPSIGFFYDACDVFVMPTHNDYRSVAVLEAMRFGKPILDSVGDGNASDAVMDGVNGFIFSPIRPDDLARSMRRLIDQPSLVVEMGEKSNERVSDLRAESSAQIIVRLLTR